MQGTPGSLSPSQASLTRLLKRVRACTECAAFLPLGPRPVLRAHSAARVLIIGQAPAYQPADPVPAVAPNTANIRVFLTDPDAKVWFDGTLTTQGGLDRLYHTPTLTAGNNYSYRIRAAWMQNGKEMVQESVTQVTPGQTAVVDFTKPFSEPVPLPK